MNTIAIKSPLDSPIRRMTPMSKVFVSVVIMSSEYISKIDITTNKMITMLNTRPRKSRPKLYNCILSRIFVYPLTG